VQAGTAAAARAAERTAGAARHAGGGPLEFPKLYALPQQVLAVFRVAGMDGRDVGGFESVGQNRHLYPARAHACKCRHTRLSRDEVWRDQKQLGVWRPDDMLEARHQVVLAFGPVQRLGGIVNDQARLAPFPVQLPRDHVVHDLGRAHGFQVFPRRRSGGRYDSASLPTLQVQCLQAVRSQANRLLGR
jgi:hypothetical protein